MSKMFACQAVSRGDAKGEYAALDYEDVEREPRPHFSEKTAGAWMPRIDLPSPTDIDQHQRGLVKGTDMGALARCIRVLFPSFKFSAVLMAAYERTCPDGGDVNLKTLCKHLVYINNNLTVYDIAFDRSWFGQTTLGIKFHSQTGRDVVIEDMTKAEPQLAKMQQKQPSVSHLDVGDVLIGLDQQELTGDFAEKFKKVRSMRKSHTLTFAKLATVKAGEDPLESLSDEELTKRLMKDGFEDDADQAIGVPDIARLVRQVYPKFSRISTIKTAYHASKRNDTDSMDLQHFKVMLRNLVLFNNEARTFDEIEDLCRGSPPKMGERVFRKAVKLLSVDNGNPRGDSGEKDPLAEQYRELVKESQGIVQSQVAATPGKQNLQPTAEETVSLMEQSQDGIDLRVFHRWVAGRLLD